MHCLGERALFSSSFVAVFWHFLPSNALITLYNIRFWWFFLSKGNRWTKYLAHPKIHRPKPCLLVFASLVALDGFHLLLFTQLTANLTPEWSSGTCFIHCYIFTQKFLFVVLKQLQTMFWILDALFWTMIHFEHSFLIDKCSCKLVNRQPSDIFNSSAISHNFNLQSAKMSLWSFLVFSGTTSEFGWPECSASFVSLRPCLNLACHLLTVVSNEAESKQHLLGHYFAWTVFFPIRRQCFINKWNSDFSII